MGIPKFFRWLTARYTDLLTRIYPDRDLAVDNFYLDMNGIIHNCSHSDGISEALSMDAMMDKIFKYLDHCVVDLIKPRKLLYLAIDGCAPRAKMNQQRARRFRARQEMEEALAAAEGKGAAIANAFDSNCITPGTEFMSEISARLHTFIQTKLREDPRWAHLQVVYSGHDVPGEGEHKIMQYIRDYKAGPHYDPAVTHCMYGNDADLILLALATHEPNFCILREEQQFGKIKEVRFQTLSLSLLRHHIFEELSVFPPESAADYAQRVERLVDEFIFMTFFVGNDFLPHLPSMDIGDDAFDMVFQAYRYVCGGLELGYIVEGGEVLGLDRFERLCRAIGSVEGAILQRRAADGKKKKKWHPEPVGPTPAEKETAYQVGLAAHVREAGLLSRIPQDNVVLEPIVGKSVSVMPKSDYAKTEDDFTQDLKSGDQVEIEGCRLIVNYVKAPKVNEANVKSSGKLSFTAPYSGLHKKKAVVSKSSGERDYRSRYYFDKFKVFVRPTSSCAEDEFLATLCTHYLKGLCWCFSYYMKGCVSWGWFFPYHYGPFLADMTNLRARAASIEFDLGAPFHPYQQLLGCLPPASSSLLPGPYRSLMTDPSSPIRDFYPASFAIDMNGKTKSYEAVVLLGFIDADRLREAESAHCHESRLSPKERQRNKFGKIHVYRQDSLSSADPSFSPGTAFRGNFSAANAPSNLSRPRKPAVFVDFDAKSISFEGQPHPVAAAVAVDDAARVLDDMNL